MEIENSARRPPRAPTSSGRSAATAARDCPDARTSGGRGSSSNWWTDSAPCRCAVPRQSAPVSPPPMMTTRLPAALMSGSSGTSSPSQRGSAGSGSRRRSESPAARGPGTGRSRGQPAPPPSTMASNSCAQRRDRTSTPTLTPARNSHAFLLEQREPPVEEPLLDLEFRDAVAQQSADAVGLLEDRDEVPGACSADPRRRGRPDPIRRPRRASRCAGRRRAREIHPSSNARSTIDSSMFLIVTGSSLMPSTHEPSHGAGHSRPVKSGKLLVACSRSLAACHRCR